MPVRNAGDQCERCGATLSSPVRLMDPADGGARYVYRCSGCDHLNWRDMPPPIAAGQQPHAQQQQQTQPEKKDDKD